MRSVLVASMRVGLPLLLATTFGSAIAVGLGGGTTAAADTSLCGAPTNPWGITYCNNGGTKIYKATLPTSIANICETFGNPPGSCVGDIDTAENGYLVQCVNGKMSMSGGISDVCSSGDGGVGETAYFSSSSATTTSAATTTTAVPPSTTAPPTTAPPAITAPTAPPVTAAPATAPLAFTGPGTTLELVVVVGSVLVVIGTVGVLLFRVRRVARR